MPALQLPSKGIHMSLIRLMAAALVACASITHAQTMSDG